MPSHFPLKVYSTICSQLWASFSMEVMTWKIYLVLADFGCFFKVWLVLQSRAHDFSCTRPHFSQLWGLSETWRWSERMHKYEGNGFTKATMPRGHASLCQCIIKCKHCKANYIGSSKQWGSFFFFFSKKKPPTQSLLANIFSTLNAFMYEGLLNCANFCWFRLTRKWEATLHFFLLCGLIA